MKVYLLLSCLAAVGSASPLLFSPAAGTSTYSFRYEGPTQSRHEARDLFGTVQGGYSVRYSHGGLLTQSYRFPAPVFRLIGDGPLAAGGAIVSLQTPTPILSATGLPRTGGVVVHRVLLGDKPALIADPVTRQTPGDTVFINSKESPVLVALRKESEEQVALVGREPPLEGPDSFIVEARGVADNEVPL